MPPIAMIIAAATSSSFSPDNLPVNWFDVALLIVLGFGIFRGRKNGMTKEILPFLKWVTLVVAAGLAYGLVAQYYVTSCGMSHLTGAVLGYLSIAFVVFFIFSLIKKAFEKRLEGSNAFGNAEYYLAIPSGMIRYACIVIFALALINSRHYTSADLEQAKAYNERWYGGGIYSGNYIPDLHTVQEAVFKKSFVGPYIKTYLGTLLIETGPGDVDNSKQAAVDKKPNPVVHIGN